MIRLIYLHLSNVYSNIYKNFFNNKKDTRFYYLSLLLENDNWSIHGLWPQNSKTDYPSYCRKVTFNIALLDPIMNQLKDNWYSDKGPDNIFWEHEWKKHGSCMFNESNEYDYFNNTLTLFNKVKALKIINKFKQGDKALIPFDLEFNVINS